MKCVLTGYGEIGSSVYKVYQGRHQIDVHDPDRDEYAEGIYDVLLVAFPWTPMFDEYVMDYQRRFKPDATIIFSTVPIGTCDRLGATHCPIEGTHPNLADAIRNSDKFLGNANETTLHFFRDHTCFQLPARHTEFLKLRSTTLYGINIEFARYSKAVADYLDMPYENVKHWDRWYNRLYADDPNVNRYILDPPNGRIGGHCVVPNADILYKQYPHPFVEIVRSQDG